MADIGRRTVVTARRLVRDRPATSWSPRTGTPRTDLVNGDGGGYVTLLDSTRLCRVAREVGGVTDLDVAIGDHLVPGQVLGRVWGVEELSAEQRGTLVAAVGLASERDLRVDAAFGVRQLLDIADRALSPGVNDPTTAVQVVHELTIALRILAGSPDPSPYLVQDDTVVAVYRPVSYSALLEDVVAELCHYAANAPRVLAALESALQDLRDLALPQHRGATDAALARLRAADDEPG
jgi:uncharacterized membrane protein